MSLLDRRIRGFRLVDVVAAGLLVALVMSVYLDKTIAGKERAEIARVEREIGAERARIRLLQAEVTHLERPGRISALSIGYLGLAPVTAKRETTPEGLSELVRIARPSPAPAAPAPTVAPAGEPVT